MEIEGFGVFKAFGGKFYKERIFEKLMISLGDRLDYFPFNDEEELDLEDLEIPHTGSIEIYGPDVLIGAGMGWALSAIVVGGSPLGVVVGVGIAAAGAFSRVKYGSSRQLSETAKYLRGRLTKERFRRIASRDGFYDA